ncbi:MAG: lactonase family protein [Opitutaceae bacterium]|nr:lactonase family protein [Opitutaceae bacterium]
MRSIPCLQRPKSTYFFAVLGLSLWFLSPLSAQKTTSSQMTQSRQTPQDQLVLIGTYTDKSTSEGIYLFRFQPTTEVLTPVGIIRDITNPAFIAIHPNNQTIYTLSEVNGSTDHQGGSVSAYQINRESLEITFLNKVSTGCAGPCHLTVDKERQNLFVAHYTGGAVSSHSLLEDGRLSETRSIIHLEGSGPHPRQKKPHTHSVNITPSNHFALVADLGIDRVVVYDRDTSTGHLRTTESLSDAILHPGAGPRHLAFHPSRPFVYTINELDSTISLFSFDEVSGFSTEKQTISTLPVDFDGNNATAEIKISPSGNFLYGSNRGHDSLAIYSINTETGMLTLLGHQSSGGQNPRNFEIDPTGTYLFVANQNSNDISIFRISSASGELTPLAIDLQVPRPVCIKMIPIPIQKNSSAK